MMGLYDTRAQECQSSAPLWWLAEHAATAGAALALLAAAAALAWRAAARRAAARALDVRVDRGVLALAGAGVAGGGGGDGVLPAPAGAVLSSLELDADVAAQDFPGLRLASVGAYMSSLHPRGEVSAEGAIVSALQAHGLRAALPLALFCPSSWRTRQAASAALVRTPAAGLLLSNMLTTQALMSAGITAHREHLAAAAARRAKEGAPAAGAAAETALGLWARGGGVAPLAPGARFNLGADWAAAVAAVPAPAPPDPAPVHPLFPDLFYGNGGQPLTCSARRAAANAVLAALLNRLAANSVVGRAAFAAGAPAAPFVVGVASGVDVASVEDFIAALEARGHTATVRITSNVTSFGAGLSVREPGGAWTQLPLAYPLGTGLLYFDDAGNASEATTLMQHAGVQLAVDGPEVSASAEWCLAVRGFTGWVPDGGVSRPWATAPAVEHAAAALAACGAPRAALRLTTASSAALNAAASARGMMLGGYGALGVCIDSVAGVQHALTGECSLYPLVLGGTAKAAVLASYAALRGGGGGKEEWAYEREGGALRAALLALPCDGVVEPGAAAGAARRAAACLPRRSVFAGVARCRASLEAAASTAEKLLAGGDVRGAATGAAK